MAILRYNNQKFTPSDGQTVLDTLLSEGQTVPHSCKTGACQTCMMKASSGTVPEKAQKGLKDSLKAQAYFLACQCQPESDMEIGLVNDSSIRVYTEVMKHEKRTNKVLLLQLKRPEAYEYIPGQYLTLWKDATHGRSYSIASVPDLSPDILELHIRRVEGGEVSTWLYDEIKQGDQVQIQDAVGHCCYAPVEKNDSLMLAGGGTGLAPLIGIAQDALTQGHKGDIHLFHSARKVEGLYKHDELNSLSQEYGNFYYHPILDGDESDPKLPEIKKGDLSKHVLEFVGEPADWRFYLCGSEMRVNQLRRKLFLSGAAMKNIYADAFVQRSN